MTRPAVRAISPTEAILALAAAVTPDEAMLAQLALIDTGGRMTRTPDPALLVSGDGSAGWRLLGGYNPRHAAGMPRLAPSCAIRSRNIRERDRVSALPHRSDGWPAPRCVTDGLAWPCPDAEREGGAA